MGFGGHVLGFGMLTEMALCSECSTEVLNLLTECIQEDPSTLK